MHVEQCVLDSWNAYQGRQTRRSRGRRLEAGKGERVLYNRRSEDGGSLFGMSSPWLSFISLLLIPSYSHLHLPHLMWPPSHPERLFVIGTTELPRGDVCQKEGLKGDHNLWVD